MTLSPPFSYAHVCAGGMVAEKTSIKSFSEGSRPSAGIMLLTHQVEGNILILLMGVFALCRENKNRREAVFVLLPPRYVHYFKYFFSRKRSQRFVRKGGEDEFDNLLFFIGSFSSHLRLLVQRS